MVDLTGELKQDTSETARPAAFFTLDRNYSAGRISRYGSLFCEGNCIKSLLNNDGLLPLDNPDVKCAIESAFNDIPSLVRFRQTVNEMAYYFDLYCFPEIDRENSSIGCFLVDRCRDVEAAISLQRKIERLDIINQAVRAFSETTNLNEILRIILLAVTSGPGLGFNRGFIFLSDESCTYLHGCLATGPSSPAEAGEIWENLSEKPLSLAEILRFYRSGESPFDTYVNQLVTSLKIPLAENSGFLKRCYEKRQALVIDSDLNLNEHEISLKRKLGAESLAVVPLVSRDSWLGVIMADNLITNKPISSSDLQLLEIFARYASDAIDNTQLYARLQREIAKLKEANEEIIKTRENLIRSEKLTGISKMALVVAHEIRNPLTVIGGHANARLRKMEGDPENERIYGIISKQAARIENTLNRFSSIVSLSEKKDGEFNIGELVLETLKTLVSVKSEKMPRFNIDDEAKGSRIFIDQGLFHKAMMIIFREASVLAGGLSRLRLEIKEQHNTAVIYVGRDEANEKFAHSFFDAMRAGQSGIRSQEISVALEILKHYGGDMGIGSPEMSRGWLAVEFPLIKEEK
ncbi:MAG: GAF domain-containing sensor histidine kinase [Candidatus Zixiibacteriota bacterium]|nr:MAG: GAF domain-containing sensor histidine kinase [candidate division Zixibacteria bacterium]